MEEDEDVLNNSNGATENQMFKDLFQVNKAKGIAGIQNVQISQKKSAGTSIDEDSISPITPDMISGGPKLVQLKKAEELGVAVLSEEEFEVMIGG